MIVDNKTEKPWNPLSGMKYSTIHLEQNIETRRKNALFA